MKYARWGALVLAFCWRLPGWPQTRLTLADVGARTGADFEPARSGQTVLVRGVVNAPAFHFPGYTVATFEDATGGGVLDVLATDARLDPLSPGDEIQVTGSVGTLAGLPVIHPTSIAVVGRQKPPGALALRLAQLQNLTYLGRLVTTEGVVNGIGYTTAGETLFINEGEVGERVFVPHPTGSQQANLATYVSNGDRVRVTAIAFQYSPRKPHNRDFELLVGGTANILRTSHGWLLSPWALATSLGLAVLAALLVWVREHRVRRQRAILRRIYQLGEEILSSPTPESACARISEAMPGILGITRVRVFIHNRTAESLEETPASGGGLVSIPLASPPGRSQSGAVACFHYRTRLVVPDTGRSPFPVEPGRRGSPRSQLFVPMLTQGGLVGVIELDRDNRTGDFDADHQALAQHLANQMAVALKLLDQRSVQEQLFRTEKLAAVGSLISGVVNELRTPLASISDLAQRAARNIQGPAGKDLAAIAAEAEKAAAMVSRLVSFATNGPGEARPVSITSLLRNLVDFRERDWKASGIKVRALLSDDPLMVTGSQGQLEQVFLRLLVHAEQSLAEASDKVLTIRSSMLARMAVVEIVFFNVRGGARGVEDLAAMLGVARGVIAGHGGEVRLIDKSGAEARFEVELPIVAKERAVDRSITDGTVPPGRRLTALLIETEEATQRQILHLLSARGYRVVPVNNADTGLDLAQRMRFDVVLCSVRAPGLNWVEAAERMQNKVTGFVLLSDGYDAELAANFEGDGRYVLAKPVQEQELVKILSAVERTIPV